MPIALPRFQELQAPGSWRTVEFISDLHLQAAHSRTFDAWRRYMASTDASAVFILGDLFEAWPGDDAALEPGFDAECAQVLRDSARQRPVFFMHGNRDFLVGKDMLEGCGVSLLHDPTIFGFAGERLLLSHGDLLCLDDVDYLHLRNQVRSAEWQAAVLAQPLSARRALARKMREQSESHHRASPPPSADVDPAECIRWLRAAGAATLIHGHTHRPAEHALGAALRRIVLSDWDADAVPPRMQVLRLDESGARRIGAD